MKAVLLLGNDFTQMSKETLAVVSNSDAISVNQDALGIAGRRVKSVPPTNLTLVDSGDDALALLAPCVPGKKEQQWTYTTKEQKPQPTILGIAPCNASDQLQFWNFSVDADLLHVWTPLRPVVTGECVDSTLSHDPLETSAECEPHQAAQAFTLRSGTAQIKQAGPGSRCLDVYKHTGPDVELSECKTAGGKSTLGNQQWTVLKQRSTAGADWSTGMLQTRSEKFDKEHPMCLTVSSGVAGGVLSTTDSAGKRWFMSTPSTMESNVFQEDSARAKTGKKKRISFAPFYAQNDHSTKKGSGQT
jgi:hypothetical protein